MHDCTWNAEGKRKKNCGVSWDGISAWSSSKSWRTESERSSKICAADRRKCELEYSNFVCDLATCKCFVPFWTQPPKREVGNKLFHCHFQRSFWHLFVQTFDFVRIVSRRCFVVDFLKTLLNDRQIFIVRAFGYFTGYCSAHSLACLLMWISSRVDCFANNSRLFFVFISPAGALTTTDKEFLSRDVVANVFHVKSSSSGGLTGWSIK